MSSKPSENSSPFSESDNGGGDFKISPLRMLNPAEWIGVEPPIRSWIVNGWIPAGAVTLLTGDGGTGKSLLALQLMMACAKGEPLLGLDTEACRSLGVFCEDSVDELHRRVHSMAGKLGALPEHLDKIRLISRLGDDNLLEVFSPGRSAQQTPFFSQIKAAILTYDAELVVLDTAADLFGGNENVRAEVRQFLSTTLGRLARDTGAAIVLISHPSASGRDSGRGDGGSTAWNNSVRSRLYLKRPDGGSNGENYDPNARVLSREKANYASAGTIVECRYEDGVFASDEGEVETWLQEKIRKDQAEKAFLAGMRELSDTGVQVNTYSNQSNFAPKALRDCTSECDEFDVSELKLAMNRLIKDGKLKIVETGPPSRKRSQLIVIE